jgi:hypothetical protein
LDRPYRPYLKEALLQLFLNRSRHFLGIRKKPSGANFGKGTSSLVPLSPLIPVALQRLRFAFREALINSHCHFERSWIARLSGQSSGVEKPAVRGMGT